MKKDLGIASEEVSNSCSPLGRRLVLLVKDKEGKSRKRKKSRGGSECGDESPVRMARRRLSEGLSPSKAVAGEQPCR